MKRISKTLILVVVVATAGDEMGLGCLNQFAQGTELFQKISFASCDVPYLGKSYFARADLNTQNHSYVPKGVNGSAVSQSRDKAISIAMTEAIERLSFYKIASEQPVDFGLDKDPSTTGFCALPLDCGELSNLYEKSYFEALERYLVFLWAHENLNLEVDIVSDSFTGYFCKINLPRYKFLRSLNACFYLSVQNTKQGGALTASSCSAWLEDARRASFKELWNGTRKLDRLVTGREALDSSQKSEERLLRFGTSAEGRAKIQKLTHCALNSDSTTLYIPAIALQKEYQGDYYPHIRVSRIMLEGSTSIKDAKEWDPIF